MKTSLLLVLALCLSFTLSAQTVQTNKMALAIKKTATWCSPCGTWAWSLFDDIYARNTGQPFIPVEMHSSMSSQLNASVSTTLYSHLEQRSSTPVFYVNNVNETEYASSGGIYPTYTKNNVFDAVDSVGQVAADINAGYTATVDNGVVTVNTKVKAFNSVTGDYYLGVYLVERDVEEYQSGIGNGAVHKVILREAISANHMGDQIEPTGSIAAGTEFSNTYTHTLNTNYDTTKLQVFVVIWEKVGSDYNYESAYSDRTDLRTAVTNNINRVQDVTFTPTAYTDGAQLHYQLKDVPAGAKVQTSLINVSGQIVRELYQGTTYAPVQESWSIGDLPKGIYFVRTIVNGQVHTLQLVL